MLQVLNKLLLRSMVSVMLIFIACEEPTDDIDDTSEPIAIFLVTEVDTIL
ncbi:MAG: hypothetical protein HQ528_05290, partial [Candidatus Marinimicrobia bacterium]|nr:hypothetical protein [Candidatus Neomarinimicrobiota bacterium]